MTDCCEGDGNSRLKNKTPSVPMCATAALRAAASLFVMPATRSKERWLESRAKYEF